MAVDTNGSAADAADTLDNMKPPAGVIIPPPGEIREAIEKTAGYVMRGGLGLEQRIRDNHGQNPKFSFLMSASDAYNAYYEWRKDEIQAGRGTAIAAGRAGEAAAAPVKEAPKGPAKPPDYRFSARMPRMSQKDLEIVRVTALYVAKNGRQFMTQLAQRETSNPQFQFLIPNHTFHNFFQSLIDQYTLLLRDSGVNGEGTKDQEERVAEVDRNITNRFHVVARARQRAEYAKWQEKEKAKAEEEEEKKKVEFASIDWNDFVVVETIVFNEADEQAQLPPPTTLNDLQYASLEEKNKISISSNLRIEEAFPFEDTHFNAHPVPQAAPQPVAPQQALPVQLPSRPTTFQPGPGGGGRARTAQEEEEELRIQEREQARARMHQAQSEAKGNVGPVKIRENYVPRASMRGATTAAQVAICPNCKQQIPISELDEHMRSKPPSPFWLIASRVSSSRSLTQLVRSRTSGSSLEGAESQGRRALRYHQPLHGRRRQEPQAPRQPTD